jgi:hypothetical protein
MTKDRLSQHGDFDRSVEASVYTKLLTEFTESALWADEVREWNAGDFGEIADGFDFSQLCQRTDGSLYGIAGGKQCRIGTPTTARDKPVRAGARGAGADPSRQINKRFLREVTTQKLQQYLDERKLYGYQRKVIEAELKRREQGGDQKIVLKPAPGESTQVQALINKKLTSETPYGLDKDLGVMVNKKLLAQDTAILQRILRERSLNPNQRAKVEEEVAGRGESPASAQAPPKREALGQKGSTKIEGVPGYDAAAVYNRPDNEKLGEGAMGAAYRTKGPPPGVVKEGAIGEQEAAAWQRLQGSGRVPEFHGAVVSTDMKPVEGGLGGHVYEAKGFLGMGEAQGKPAAQLYLDRENQQKLVDEYVRTRRDIHLRGVAHNDMHGGNFFFDTNTGKGQLVDFGLAQVSYKAALVEAISTFEGDWQAETFLTRRGGVLGAPGATTPLDRLEKGIDRAERILQRRGINPEAVHRAGIRTPQAEIDQILGPMTEDQAKATIEYLYDGI